MTSEARLGATPLDGDRCRFRVWAPSAEAVELRLLDPDRSVALEAAGDGYFAAVADDVAPGRRYRYALDGGEPVADPTSAWQPDGVHGPSAVAAIAFGWSDAGWPGVPLDELVLYELHVGTFTPEGSFDAVIPRLAELRELGITALEIMPVSEFPGGRNWGYDGVFPYAVQSTYGGPDGLKRLVDAAHAAGLAVYLDVVYNHLGPEGNVLHRFGPYFTDRYRTPWGEAVNVDGPGSDAVRDYLIGNALRWSEEFHLDGLRLDAVDQIADNMSALPFLADLHDRARAQAERLGRSFRLIAESDLNAPRTITERAAGGLGMDAQWADDFHHSLHALLTGERFGYYGDFGATADLADAAANGFVYRGRRSRYRGRRHGASPAGLPANRFVICSQNHDQIGNRAAGDRLISLAGDAAARLAAGAVLLAPAVPLVFMGEEYGETAPFPYFVSHTDPELVEAVRKGRAAEFAAFGWQGDVPDPQSEETFRSATLAWEGRDGSAMLALYRELLRLRRELPLDRETTTVSSSDAPPVVWLRRGDVLVCLHFGAEDTTLELPYGGEWDVLLDSAGEAAGLRPGTLEVRAQSFVVMQQRGSS